MFSTVDDPKRAGLSLWELVAYSAQNNSARVPKVSRLNAAERLISGITSKELLCLQLRN
jgi:hypothetical protein